MEARRGGVGRKEKRGEEGGGEAWGKGWKEAYKIMKGVKEE